MVAVGGVGQKAEGSAAKDSSAATVVHLGARVDAPSRGLSCSPLRPMQGTTKEAVAGVWTSVPSLESPAPSGADRVYTRYIYNYIFLYV